MYEYVYSIATHHSEQKCILYKETTTRVGGVGGGREARDIVFRVTEPTLKSFGFKAGNPKHSRDYLNIHYR